MMGETHEEEMRRSEQAHALLQEPSSSARGGVQVLLEVLGVSVPLLGGFAIIALPSIGILLDPTAGLLTVVEVILLACLGAGLLRSWWALLIVPLALGVGMMLAAAVTTLLQGGSIDLQEWAAHGFEPLDIVVILGLGPALIGAVLGVFIGKRVQGRQHQ